MGCVRSGTCWVFAMIRAAEVGDVVRGMGDCYHSKMWLFWLYAICCPGFASNSNKCKYGLASSKKFSLIEYCIARMGKTACDCLAQSVQ